MNKPFTSGRTAFISGVICLSLVGCIPKTIQHPQTAPSIEKEDSFVAAIGNVKASIAPVVCVQPHPTGDWDLVTIEGTAVFISADGSFITPKHVIDGLTLPNRLHPCPFPALYLPEDGIWRVDRQFRIHYALFIQQTCVQDGKLDLALCSIAPGGLMLLTGKAVPFSPIQFDSDTPPEGTAVAFTGFPLSNTIPISAIGHVASYQSTAENGIFTLIIDRGNWPGASGSPAYLPNGKVIGIVLARGTGDAIGLTLARVSHVIIDMLKQQKKGQ